MVVKCLVCSTDEKKEVDLIGEYLAATYSYTSQYLAFLLGKFMIAHFVRGDLSSS